MVERFAKLHSVSNATAVIDRQDNVTLVGEVLVEGVRVMVVAHVVPTQQHLSTRPAMEQNDRGPSLTRAVVPRQEKLAVDLHPIGSRKNNGLRLHEVLLREVG